MVPFLQVYIVHDKIEIQALADLVDLSQLETTKTIIILIHVYYLLFSLGLGTIELTSYFTKNE